MVRQAKAQRMLSHDQIWGALDRLAARAGLSPSGLAKRAGLDPTTFNKSKRVTSDGRERWPSTESIAKALAAADSSIDTFARLVGDDEAAAARCRCSASRWRARAAPSTFGFPSGKGRTEFALPGAEGNHSFALEMSGEALAPAYRDGDIILVSPGAPIRKGDRVVVKMQGGRGDGGDAEAPHGKGSGFAAARCDAGRADDGGERAGVDRKDRVGKPVRQ